MNGPGFGSNLLPEKRAELATAVYGWAHESPADHRRVLDSYWSSEKGARPSLSMFYHPCFHDICLMTHVLIIYVSGRLMSFAPDDGNRPVSLDELTSVEGVHVGLG